MENKTEPSDRKNTKSKKVAKPKARPKFIVVEGGEGSGKSTLLIALKEIYGDKIFVTREPGGSPYAEVIREATLKNPLAKTAPAETTFCLMFAARFDNVKNSILPSLERGVPVIADRFDSSSYAYQVCGQSGGTLENMFWDFRNRLAVLPDLYIYMDVDPKEGLRRASLRNQSLLSGKQYDHFDDREIEFHTAVRDGYLKFLKKVPNIIIDANKPLEEVKDDFLAQMKGILKS
jgi:dTMP kinase